MSERTCAWPTCGRDVSDRYTALPLCTIHAEVAAHQVAITNEPTLAIRTPVPRPRSGGSIYYLHVDGFIKIGFAQNLPHRLRSYPPHGTLLAHSPGTYVQEQALHSLFGEHRAHRREWYEPCAAIAAHIAGLGYDEPPLPISDWLTMGRTAMGELDPSRAKNKGKPAPVRIRTRSRAAASVDIGRAFVV